MILEKIRQEQEQNRHIYIRGTAMAGIYLGIYLDWSGIQFEGYIDNNPDLVGKTVYGKHLCYSPDQVPKESFILVTAKKKKVQNEITSELDQEGISYLSDIYPEIHECMKDIDDEFFLKNLFNARMGYDLNLDNPRTLCEKLQWLKLYDQNPLYAERVDKYEVKKYVAKLIGSQYVIPALGVWDKFADIDFNELPDRFVLKWTHDSGSIVVIENKSEMNRNAVKMKLDERAGQNYFYFKREWAYKNIKPRIIAEPYIDTLGKLDSIEYKVTCFNGKVGFVTVCKGIAHSSFDVRTNDSYTVNFEHMPWYSYYKNSTDEIQKPECWDELISFSEKLAADIPYLRVDWYVDGGKLYFGEMTFYTWAGFIEFTPPEWDLKLGECLKLPEKAVKNS